MLGILILLCGLSFAQEPKLLAKNDVEVETCPTGYQKTESVEIKCGSSSEWAVISNPSIDIWNPICETRSSLVCALEDLVKDKPEEKIPEITNPGPLISMMRSFKIASSREGTSLKSTPNIPIKKPIAPQCYTQLENVQKCHNIPVPGNPFAFTTPCYTVKELRRYCPNVNVKNNSQRSPQRLSQPIPKPKVATASAEKLDCSKSIIYAKECKPRRTPRCEIVKKIKEGCQSGDEDLIDSHFDQIKNEKINVENNEVAVDDEGKYGHEVTKSDLDGGSLSYVPSEYSHTVPTFIPEILKPVRPNVCRPKENYRRKCQNIPVFWNNQRHFTTHCEIIKETVDNCPKKKAVPLNALPIQDSDGGEDLIKYDGISSLDGIDGDEFTFDDKSVVDESNLNKKEIYVEHNAIPKNMELKVDMPLDELSNNEDIQDVPNNYTSIVNPLNNDNGLTIQGSEVENHLTDEKVLDDNVNLEKTNYATIVTSNISFPQYTNIPSNDSVSIDDIGESKLKNENKPPAVKEEKVLTMEHKEDMNIIKEDPSNEGDEGKKYPKETKLSSENVVNDNRNTLETEKIGHAKDHEDERKSNSKETKIAADKIPSNSNEHLATDTIAEESYPHNVQDSFFSCSKREVCEEVLENKCTEEDGPRPETICSDVSLEDCSVTPLGSAYETCDTVYNKYCRPRLTDLDKRIYDESLKEKQRSISFGQSEGEYEYETLFEDEFHSLFNEEGEDNAKEVAPASKDCQVVEVESCNTHHHLDVDTGRRWSCLDVPTVSCETFLNSESRFVKNCKQSKASKCQQFNVVGHIIQPSTKCKTEKITHCSEVGKPRKSGLDLVDCELEKKYICGPHHTTQLVLNECSWNLYPVCHKLHAESSEDILNATSTAKSSGQIRRKREICRDVLTKKCRMVTDCS